MPSSKLENQSTYVKVAIIGAIILLGGILVIRFASDIFETPEFPGVGKPGSDHQHATRFAVFMEDERISFSPVMYPKYRDASEYILMEIEDGNKIHRFATGATLKMFFDSVGMEFSKECFKLDPEDTFTVANKKEFRAEYCNDGNKTLQFYVNDVPHDDFENYVAIENDRVLITFDPSPEGLVDQINMLYQGRGPGLAMGGGASGGGGVNFSCGEGTQFINGVCEVIKDEELTP